MITLHGFGPAFGQPDISPFVMKVMILMRMAGLPFVKKDGFGGIRRAPRGKLPFIEDDGRIISDSRVILRYLEDVHGADFSGGYDETRLATGILVERTLEESNYFISLRRRWLNDDGWSVMEPIAFGGLPRPVRALAGPFVRRSIRRSLRGQGSGRLTDAENEAIAAENTRAVALTLGDRPYLLGERPCRSDATLLSFTLAATANAFPGPIRDAILKEPNLVA